MLSTCILFSHSNRVRLKQMPMSIILEHVLMKDAQRLAIYAYTRTHGYNISYVEVQMGGS